MAGYDYNKERFETVRVCGIECLFHSMRINRNTIPEGKYQYELAGDDDSGGDPARMYSKVKVADFMNFDTQKERFSLEVL